MRNIFVWIYPLICSVKRRYIAVHESRLHIATRILFNHIFRQNPNSVRQQFEFDTKSIRENVSSSSTPNGSTISVRRKFDSEHRTVSSSVRRTHQFGVEWLSYKIPNIGIKPKFRKLPKIIVEKIYIKVGGLSGEWLWLLRVAYASLFFT